MAGCPTSELNCPTSGAEDIPKLGIPSWERPPLDLTWPKGYLGDSSGGLAGSSLSLAQSIRNLLGRATPRYLSQVLVPLRGRTSHLGFVKRMGAPGGLGPRTGVQPGTPGSGHHTHVTSWESRLTLRPGAMGTTDPRIVGHSSQGPRPPCRPLWHTGSL